MHIWEEKNELAVIGDTAGLDSKDNEFKEYSVKGFFDEVEGLKRADNKARALRYATSISLSRKQYRVKVKVNDEDEDEHEEYDEDYDSEVEMHWKAPPKVTKEGRETVVTWCLNAYPVI